MSASNVKNHPDGKEECNNMRQWNCTDCDYTSIWERKLKIHVETVRQKGFQQKIKAHKCQDCNTFLIQNKIWQGMWTGFTWKLSPWKSLYAMSVKHPLNENVKPYGCNLCEKAFFLEKDLKTHLKRSHGAEEK